MKTQIFYDILTQIMDSFSCSQLNTAYFLKFLNTRGFIKRREAGIFPFYSCMFPLLLLINLYSQ